MTGLATIAFVCEGNAESADRAFSGSANSVVTHLRRLGHRVNAIDSEIYGYRRLMTALRSFAFDRHAWRARFHFGKEGFRARSRRAEIAFRCIGKQVDIVFQIGAAFRPPGAGSHPYVLFCDWNVALTIKARDNVLSAAHHLSEEVASEINAREGDIYAGAGAIFTFSEKLRQSFIDDYGVPPDRVVTTHPGPNFDLTRFPPPPRRQTGQPPTVVFVGRDFVRKGGYTLLEAFETVRSSMPDARLRIIGPTRLRIDQPGVDMLGMLRKSVPAECDRLIEAIQTADVLCLPTRFEPFGMVVLEAMALGVPCVTTDVWALPEMVLDDVTGYLVPVGDPGALADRLLRILGDPELARRLGETARRRIAEEFSWDAAVQKMHRRIQTIVF